MRYACKKKTKEIKGYIEMYEKESISDISFKSEDDL